MPLNFSRGTVTFTINLAIYQHNADDYKHKPKSKQSRFESNHYITKNTVLHVSELVQACPARKYTHQTGAALISSKTTIKKKHLVSLLRATFLCNDTGLRWRERNSSTVPVGCAFCRYFFNLNQELCETWQKEWFCTPVSYCQCHFTFVVYSLTNCKLAKEY